MANIKVAYGTEAQAITCSLAPGSVGLANSATVGRESTAIDNTSNLFLDALVQVQIKNLEHVDPGQTNQRTFHAIIVVVIARH